MDKKSQKLFNLFVQFENAIFLDRVNSFKQIEIKEAPMIEENIPCINRDFGVLSDKVNNFVSVLLKENINHSILYANLKTLKIKAPFIINIFNYNITGNYDSKKNRIKYKKNSKCCVLEHELLHAASSSKKGNVRYSGFCQRNNPTFIGEGLTEGYTQLLTERYFSKRKEDNIYVIEKKYANIIENIIGKDLMQNLYFKADLKGLINELNKYVEVNEILIFLGDLDFVKSLDLENVNGLKKALKRINDFVIKVYIHKMLEERDFDYEKLEYLLLYEISTQYSFYLYRKRIDVCVYDGNYIKDYIANIIDEYGNKQLSLI